MRRLAAIVAACLLTPVFVLPASATEDFRTLNTNSTLQVGAGRTLPNGSYAFSDGCETGDSATTEFRCSFEFDLSAILSSAKITQATLTITRTGGCGTNDCPIDIASFTGNGSGGLGDVVDGSNIASWTPTNNSQHNFNVLGLIVAHRDNGEQWAGFNLARAAGTHGLDVQDFSLSDADLKLTIGYIPLPVDVTVQKDGTGKGTVVSNIPGINCGSTCTGTFTFSEPLKLTAAALGGSSFVTWSGIVCDEGNQSTTCSFIVPSVPDPIVATFAKTATASPPPHSTPHPTATSSTPKPTAKASSGATQAAPTQAPGVPTAAPASPEGPPATFAPGETVGPTLTPTTPVDSGGGLPIMPIILIVGVVLAIAIGVGAYLYARSRQEMAPPG